MQEAQALYQQVLSQDPNQFEALHLLGVLAGQAGRHGIAEELIRRAIAVNPNDSEAYYNLGTNLAGQYRFAQAVDAFRQAIALQPGFTEAVGNLVNAYNHLGDELERSGQLDQAIAAYREALALRPDYAEAYNNLGNALRRKGQLDDAMSAFRRALSLRPDFPEAHNNLGNALTDLGELDAAVEAYHRAIELRPDYVAAYTNLGVTLREKGALEQSIAAFRKALSFRPDYADAHFGLAWTLLLNGDFEPGWREYEWRWRRDAQHGAREFAQPRWDGTPLNGRTILLHHEQGFGDTIQFVRYASWVAARGGRVMLECPPELIRLLRGAPGVERVVALGTPLPAFDVHCPLLSLPLAFGTTLDSIPASVPYVSAPAELIAKWSQRIAPAGRRLNVGLAWAGRPTYGNDRNRSLPASAFARLGSVEGCAFHSLAKTPAVAIPGLQISDHSADLDDFADTAALIANLDLVISVDTAVAHLAGALGKPVWLLLPIAPDWRWMLHRDDSPWYPTMRLFRQARWGDWDGVIERVTQFLKSWYNSRQA